MRARDAATDGTMNYLVTTWLRKTIAMGAMVCAACSCAVASEYTATWTAAGLDGWRTDNSQAVLSNPSSNLTATFAKRTAPMPDEATIFANGATAQGLFTGNYMERGVSSIRFEFLATTTAPNLLQLRLQTASGRQWFLTLPEPIAGKWQTNHVALAYAAGWTCGPGRSGALFSNDMRNVQWMGITVLNRASTVSVVYRIDNVTIAYEEPVTCAGTIYSASELTGPIVVVAGTAADTWVGAQQTVIPAPGPYCLTNVAPQGVYWIKAYCDVNTNGCADNWEPWGASPANPVRPDGHSLVGMNLTLNDPLSSDGIPYWWLNKHFPGTTTAVMAQYTGLAVEDDDGDGANNWAEYRAGTDPHDPRSRFQVQMEPLSDNGHLVLRWPSIADRFYAIYRSTNLDLGFSLLESGIPATPPENRYEDGFAPGQGAVFYRIQIEE